MNQKFSMWQIISGVAILLLFIMTFVMYFGIGLGYGNSSDSLFFKGFSGLKSLHIFTLADSIDTGKDIYGSGLTIVIFSAFLLPMVIGSWFIPANNRMLKLGLYILNYIFLLLIFILSIVVLAEFIQFFNNLKESNPSGYQGVSVSGVTIAFLVITGMILPLVCMGTLFDKKIFK